MNGIAGRQYKSKTVNTGLYLSVQLFGTIKNVTMGRIKETSTHQGNKQYLRAECPEVYAASLISGQWTLAICCYLINGKMRFTELKKKLPGVTERMLTLQLRKMESNKLVTRTIYPEVPLRVEYQLTPSGMALKPLLEQLGKWGLQHQQYENSLQAN
jgi:DNA-binding HxlR family transcriptional regulator